MRQAGVTVPDSMAADRQMSRQNSVTTIPAMRFEPDGKTPAENP